MRSLPVLLLLLASCGGRFRLDPRNPYEVLRTPSTVTFAEGVTGRMEVTYPEHRSHGPYPTVVLVPGAGPVDVDGTLESGLGAMPFGRLLADTLTERGFAVVRYGKRHVTDAGRSDLPKYIADQDQRTFAADLRAVLAASRKLDAVDSDRVFLLGFDEGAVVAAEVARQEPVAGLALIGAPGRPFRERLEGWFTDMELYLERFAWQGQLDGRLLARALHANAAEPVLSTSRMLALSFTRESEIAVPSPLVDRDRDGILSLDGEVEPAVPALVDYAFTLGPYGYLAGDRELPSIPDQLEGISVPLIALQGENDAFTRPVDLERIRERSVSLGREDVFVVVPGAGHALGPASHPVDD
ncbi:MAG: alpha/beta hydrolase, partial [Myxococcales bacterium]|nr:alpha/beta hydrolase [Myxococcales bacterium]